MGISIYPTAMQVVIRTLLLTLFLFTCLLPPPARAQGRAGKPLRIGLFVPLWLDSAFSSTGEYRYGKGFPRQSISGLECYQGVAFALDTLRQTGKVNIELTVFDIRSQEGNIFLVTRLPKMDSLDLLIGQVSGAEYLHLAEAARRRRIPFLSTSYPNDGGVRDNPYVLITQARLPSHLQALNNHLTASLGIGQNAIWLRRLHPNDDRLAEAFREMQGGRTPKYRTLAMPDTFSVWQLLRHLDSTRLNILIAGSLDEAFGLRLVENCLSIDKAYRITVIGMPTWEGLSALRSSRYQSIPIEHTVAFYRPAIAAWGDRLEEEYRRRTYSRPSDVVFKSFQAAYHLTRLLLQYDTAWRSHLNDPELSAQSDFNFQPARIQSATVIDYLENKRIYLIRREEGSVSQLR